jgi:hypothetical protein
MRLLSAIVCDDIRTELTGKDIIIGCYNNVLLIPKVPAILTSLNFRFLFDQEPAGKHLINLSIYDPSGKLLLKTGGEIVVEEANEPFVIRIGSAPFGLESFGKYEVRSTKSEAIPVDRGDLLLEFFVREPKTPAERALLPNI